MKLTLDIPSVLFTLTAVVGAVVLAGAAPLQSVGTDRDVQATEDVSRRRARDLICIKGVGGAASDPFVVPTGKILVLTGGTSTNRPDYSWQFSVGTTAIAMTQVIDGSGGKTPNNAIEFLSGLPVPSGETVQIPALTAGSTRLLFGYLEDE